VKLPQTSLVTLFTVDRRVTAVHTLKSALCNKLQREIRCVYGVLRRLNHSRLKNEH
jgi:hypothetical protein